ncbi:hypothetical protein FACS189467_2980 [Bacteroidia bacterium]|nr:hypothetical protein FACS189467_2980 [Bacteroidia bacterium]
MKKSKQESAGDELYTTYETVDKILRTHIADGKLRGKRILCPCDPILPIRQQPTKVYENGVHFAQGNKFLKEQQFVRWIDDHAVELGIKSLTCCGLGDERFGTRFGEDLDVSQISFGKDGNEIFDFQNGENLKDKCDMFRTTTSPDFDVIITNPPFSLGSDFVYHLLNHNKDFILILQWNFYCSEAFYGNLDRVKLGAVIHKNENFAGKNIEVNDKGINIVHKGNESPIGITIFTTFDVVENQSLHINQAKSYVGNEADYPFALNTKEPVLIVDKTCNIPYDYDGLMCVPLTFMDNWNKNEFEVLGYSQHGAIDEEKNKYLIELHKQDIQKIKKQLLLKPNDLKYQSYLKRGYSDTGFEWRPARLYYKNDKKGLIRNMTGFLVKNKPNKTQYITPKAAPKLKNDNPLLNNKIYFYTSSLVPDCICIGQTKGDVEKRIKQEFKNTPEKPYKILHSDLAQKANGEWFKDKDFHKFLNANGFSNEIGNHSKNNEWFKIDIKTALKLFKEYKKIK